MRVIEHYRRFRRFVRRRCEPVRGSTRRLAVSVRRGTTAIEYALVLSIITMVVIASVRNLGAKMSDVFDKVTTGMDGSDQADGSDESEDKDKDKDKDKDEDKDKKRAKAKGRKGSNGRGK